MSGIISFPSTSLLELVGEALAGNTSVLPPAAPGVYCVDEWPWQSCPTDESRLYWGATGNLRSRVGQYLIDTLGCYGPRADGTGWFGHHSGAQHVRKWCLERDIPLGDLQIGWTTTTELCHWCLEEIIMRQHGPILSRQRGRRKCCCSR